MAQINSPNLFTYATKELSQDAFICWLSAWANPILKEKNPYMHAVGQEFVLRLLKTHNINATSIKNIAVKKQHINIDIILKVNTNINKYVLIIEDKKHANDYNPLTEYLERIKIDEDFEGYEPLGLFIKTGDQASYHNVTSKYFSLFLRNDFIDFFEFIEKLEGHNDILNDFKKKLNYDHQRVNSYSTLKIKDWDRESWKGFYNYIQLETKFKDWKDVSNPSGGFLCSNWPWKDMLNWGEGKEAYKVYLQIEQGSLCFKIGEVYNGKKEIRDEWHKIVMEAARSLKLNEIKKPNKMHPGVYMTVAFIEKMNWLGADNSVIDLGGVVKKLNDYSEFLFNLVNEKSIEEQL